MFFKNINIRLFGFTLYAFKEFQVFLIGMNLLSLSFECRTHNFMDGFSVSAEITVMFPSNRS